jgi:hypothetical protein
MAEDKIKMEKYLVCAYPPILRGGVNRLMIKLKPMVEREGFKCITKKESKSARYLYDNRRYFDLIIEIIRRKLDSFIFRVKCKSISNAVVIFIHPQKTGYKNLFSLLKNNNKVYLYVMDNSFFCLRSYNNDPAENIECAKCLNNVGNIMKDCIPFPQRMGIKKNIKYLNRLKEISEDLVFIAQNKNQKLLLKSHFGESIRCKVIGLNTGEISEIDYKKSIRKKNLNTHILYHGSLHLAKGINFFIDLAFNLTKYKFIIPDSRTNVENIYGSKIEISNLHYMPCKWESGLRELVEGAILVVNPSLWSAPIEGALLKSIVFNGNVATVRSRYGFEEELKNYNSILRLSNVPRKAAIQMEKYLSNDTIQDDDIHNKLLGFLKELNSNDICNYVGDFQR